MAAVGASFKLGGVVDDVPPSLRRVGQRLDDGERAVGRPGGQRGNFGQVVAAHLALQLLLHGVNLDPERVPGFQKHPMNLRNLVGQSLILQHLLRLGLARVAGPFGVNLSLHVPGLVVRARADFRVFRLPHRVRHRGSHLLQRGAHRPIRRVDADEQLGVPNLVEFAHVARDANRLEDGLITPRQRVVHDCDDAVEDGSKRDRLVRRGARGVGANGLAEPRDATGGGSHQTERVAEKADGGDVIRGGWPRRIKRILGTGHGRRRLDLPRERVE